VLGPGNAPGNRPVTEPTSREPPRIAPPPPDLGGPSPLAGTGCDLAGAPASRGRPLARTRDARHSPAAPPQQIPASLTPPSQRPTSPPPRASSAGAAARAASRRSRADFRACSRHPGVAADVLWPVPRPRTNQRAGAQLRPRHPRARPAQGRLRQLAGESFDIPLWIGGKQVRTGNTAPLIVPHRRRQPLGVFHQANPKEVNDAISPPRPRAPSGPPRVGGPRGHLPARRGPAAHRVPRPPQRRHHARPVEDGPPGRDRRRLRAHRLLPVQRPLPDPAVPRAADLPARHVEPVSSTARSTASCSPSPRSTSPRSPATCRPRRPCAATRWCGSPPPPPCSAARDHGAAARRRAPPGRHQLRARLRRRGRRPRARPPRPRRRALHRQHRRVPADVGAASPEHRQLRQPTRAWSARPAARTSCSPTERRRRVARHNLLRGAFEYQGQKCSAASRAYIPDNLWPKLREQLADGSPTQGRRRRRLPQLHGRRDRRRSYAKLKEAIAEARSARAAASTRSSAASATTARATSSAPP
jgi:hypothetical protein